MVTFWSYRLDLAAGIAISAFLGIFNFLAAAIREQDAALERMKDEEWF